jgi:hypothetical protein
MTSGGFPVITTSNGYTKAQVDTQFSNLIDSAPAALNTLKELANALSNDANYATTVQNQLALKQDRVDWLSENEINERHQIDTGLNGLLIKAGSESSILVYGTSAYEPGSMTVYKNMNVQGNIVALDSTIEADIIKTNNIQTSGEDQVSIDTNLVVNGNLTVNGSSNISGLSSNPYWASGVVDGTNLNILASYGFVDFTVSRITNYPTGVYKITYNQPHPDGANYVVLVHSRNSNSYLTPVLVEAPTPQTADYVHITLRNTTATAIANEIFHFAVVARPSSTLTASLNYNQFWVAGKVGSTGSILRSQGKNGFTVTKTGTGQYTITFAVAHPSANNIVSLTAHGYVYLSSSTATSFGVVLKNYDLALADQPFHFTVLA